MKLFQIFCRVLANYIKVPLVKKKKFLCVDDMQNTESVRGDIISEHHRKVHLEFESGKNRVLLLVTKMTKKLYSLFFYAKRYNSMNVENFLRINLVLFSLECTIWMLMMQHDFFLKGKQIFEVASK